MGNFPTLPIAGALRVSPDSILNMQTPVGKEIGTAGYYAATVDHSIRAELTVRNVRVWLVIRFLPRKSRVP